jgi:hypothetical protein
MSKLKLDLLEQDPNWLERLSDLKPNWDGEGADPPDELALIEAKEIVDWAQQNNLLVESVDPDVLGGIAVYLRGADECMVWVSILNNRDPSVIFRHYKQIVGRSYNESSLKDIKSFLLNGQIDCL